MNNEIPAIVREEPDGRTAHIARDGDSVPIGVALFFTPDELAEAGVNTAAANAVELHVEDGEVNLIPISQKER